MKPPISEHSASVSVLDLIFKQVDYFWPGVWDDLSNMMNSIPGKHPTPEVAKFNFILATTSLNLRKAFDLFPREQAERIFIQTLKLYEMQFREPRQFHAITGIIRKYMDAYNLGLTSLSNPIDQVSLLLYASLGLKSPQGGNGADAGIASFLTETLMNFSGKWEAMNEKYEVVETVV